MEEKTFKREPKGERPILAICYDFDKTLTPNDMQAQGFIQALGYDTSAFWRESNGLAEKNNMDQNLAYMYMMKKESRGSILFTKETLIEYGSKIKLFSGVENWFERIHKYGIENQVDVEHYIISSGLKEMIEGTSLAKSGAFKAIYASSFYYDEDNVAVWPAQVVNYTNKTQFLFRIEKGVLDINDPAINDYFSPEDTRVPFRNIVYIGDSDTDIPCMKLVNSYGGYSIGVYNDKEGDKTKVIKMMRDKRIKYFVSADYTEGSELDKLVKSIINRTYANEILERKHYSCLKECNEIDSLRTEEKRKEALIIALENSNSFKRTHSVIADLLSCENFTGIDKERLANIAVSNSQVRYILNDSDVATFYKKLLIDVSKSNRTEDMQTILSELNIE